MLHSISLSALPCSLPCSRGLECEGRKVVLAPSAHPVELGAGTGHGHAQLRSHIPCDPVLCNLLTPTTTLAMEPSKGITQIHKIQQHRCEFATFSPRKQRGACELGAGKGRCSEAAAALHAQCCWLRAPGPALARAASPSLHILPRRVEGEGKSPELPHKAGQGRLQRAEL